MKTRHAHSIRQGLVLADLVMQNPLLAEHAPRLLSALGYRAYLRTMKSYGHVMPGGYIPI